MWWDLYEKNYFTLKHITLITPLYIYIYIYFFFLWLENVETPNYHEWKLFTFRKNRRAFKCTYSKASLSYWVFLCGFCDCVTGFLWVLIQTQITMDLFFSFSFFIWFPSLKSSLFLHSHNLPPQLFFFNRTRFICNLGCYNFYVTNYVADKIAKILIWLLHFEIIVNLVNFIFNLQSIWPLP